MVLLFLTRNDGGKFQVKANAKEAMMDLLLEKTAIAGHVLTFDEASSDPEMIMPNSYAFYYGSFANAAKEAWSILKNHRLRPNYSDSRIKIPNIKADYSDDIESKDR